MPSPQPDRSAPPVARPQDRGAAGPPTWHDRPGQATAAELFATAREDARLAALLMQLPRAERREVVLRDPRFHRQTLAQLLVLQAESQLEDPSVDPLDAAELAAAVASALPADAARRARKTEALAWWLVGKALLRRRDWRLAEQAFSSIFALIPQREPCEEQALALTGLAQLHADLGNPDTAAAMFLQAAYRFSRLGAAEPATACQAQLGLLLFETGDLVAARLPLRVALRSVDEAFAPSLAARMLLALSQIETTLGNAGPAREHLQHARSLYDLSSSPAESIVRTWAEARIAAAAEQPGEAEPLLESVRLELLAHGSLSEAARCTFDHVLLRLDAGRSGTVAELTAALVQAFPLAADSWAAELAGLARLAAGQPETLYAAAHELRHRSRHAPLPSPGRPDLLISSRSLADRLLRRRAEHEDPLGAASACGCPESAWASGAPR
jgi:tetratricopeptide (TPR) repeat protein